jgi:mycothiol synthase
VRVLSALIGRPEIRMTAPIGPHTFAGMTVESQSLTWRPLAVSDAEAMADLLNAIDAEDHVWGQYTVEDAAEELDSPVDDLPTSTLAVFDGATMLGFSAVHYKPMAEVVHRVHAAGAVRPTHRRQGLGTRLLRHGLESAQALHALHHPTLQLVVESIYGEHVHGAVALYRAAGMTATQRALHMRHPLGAAVPDAPVPDGLRIEGYTAETDEEFRAVRNEAFQDKGTARLSAEEWKVWAVNANFRPELSFLLRDVGTGAAAGMLLTVCWEAEAATTGIRDAYLRVIGTRPAYRKRGVAQALVAHMLRAAQDQGYGRASLRVAGDSSSGGLGLAERAGFVTQDTQVHYCIDL